MSESLPFPTAKPVKVFVGFSMVRSWYRTKEEADAVGAFVEARGDTRKGGLLDGMPLGRTPGSDHYDEALGCWCYSVDHDGPVT